MTDKNRKCKADDPAQYERFLKAASEAGAAKTTAEADRAFKKIVRPAKPKPSKK